MSMKAVFVFILFLTTAFFIASCNGDHGNGNGDNGDGGSDLKISWITDSGDPIATKKYDAGILVGYRCFGYFEVAEGTGDFEVTAVLKDNAGNIVSNKSEVFDIKEEQSYKLSMIVNCSGPSNYDPGNPPPGFPNEFTLSFRTSSASNDNPIAIEGGFYTDTLSCGQLKLDTWQYTTPTWTLTAKVLPEGSGSLSDNLGLLVYEGPSANRNGEFYVSEYDHGTEITLTATPAAGYVFDHWYGTWWTERPSEPTVTFTIGIPILIEAVFDVE